MDSLVNLAPRGTPKIVLLGPAPDVSTTPALTANLICRVLFALIGNLICIVPLRLLYRNGELAAALFILVVQLQNFESAVNALIWHNDDVDSWWPGYGFCDVDSHVRNFTIGLFNSCLLAIMRNLALQIGNMRASPLTKKEKTRRNIVQALIIFPLPLLQAVWTYPLAQQRYYIGTLTGCSWANSRSWPYAVFDIFLPTMMPFLTAGYAISKATASALSNNPLAHARSQRARRRLYLMVVAILVPYVPIAVAIAIVNFRVAGALKPFNFDAIHNHAPGEIPWNAIVYITSNEIHWSYMNMCYLSIATTIPIFVFFGMTKDAMNSYRVVLLFFGLGKVFPQLHEEYDPDARILASMSNGSHSTSTSSSKKNAAHSDLSVMTSIPSNHNTSTVQQPAPAATSASLPIHNQDVHIQPIRRNPFLFRTRLDFSLPFKLSLFRRSEDNSSSAPLELLSHQPTNRSVWSDEESLPIPCAATANTQGDKGKDHPVIAPAPPVLLPSSTSNPVNGYGEL
ncbi:pheromone a factor receptor [Trichoderma gamsii]|uniref:Pheromone a factor receptor n=1 Tax=Trichoderma gamsii TaxID=398673 RepID=A0A2P4ZSG5_9HYPO|nr:pheromone a factor receptor [Trichoderma gamsii]PON27250.1 pheromone a factor receptor [Trichoderma gamsii]